MLTLMRILTAIVGLATAALIGCGAQNSSVTIDPVTNEAGSRHTEIEYGAKPARASVDVVLPPSTAETTIRVTFENGEFDAQFIKPPVPLPPPAPPAGGEPAPGPAPK